MLLAQLRLRVSGLLVPVPPGLANPELQKWCTPYTVRYLIRYKTPCSLRVILYESQNCEDELYHVLKVLVFEMYNFWPSQLTSDKKCLWQFGWCSYTGNFHMLQKKNTHKFNFLEEKSIISESSIIHCGIIQQISM